MTTYHVENFGCRATQADGAVLEHQFEARGLSHAPAAQADLVLLNTCTVTASADQDARAAIRRLQRQNPGAKIVVTGCYAQRAPQEIAALPGVTAVIGNSHKHQLADLILPSLINNREGHDFSRAASQPQVSSALAAAPTNPSSSPNFIPLTTLTENRELRTENWVVVSDIFAHTELLAAPVFDSVGENSRTRPNLKVQDGCDNRCSFCVIPSVRGQSRSLPLPQVIREVNALVAAGYKELVISGINLGRWGFDLSWDKMWGARPRAPIAGTRTNSRPFENLLRTILAQTPLQKLRISSVEPMDWTDELISLVASSPRIAKHAHVPLQSGSDAVLRRMHRKYRPWHYRERIEKVRAAMPTAAIGADVMTGFPGETDTEFNSTLRLIEDLPFTYLHVFTFSARPGTAAASLPNQIPVRVARERNKILRHLAEEKKRAFMLSFVGQQLQAITLASSNILSSRKQPADSLTRSGAAERPAVSPGPAFTEALTDNYQKVLLRGHHAANQWLGVRVDEVQDGSLLGTLANSSDSSLDLAS